MQFVPTAREGGGSLNLSPMQSMFLGDWSPDGKRILYKGSIGGVQNSFAIIATLNNVGRLKVKKEGGGAHATNTVSVR